MKGILSVCIGLTVLLILHGMLGIAYAGTSQTDMDFAAQHTGAAAGIVFSDVNYNGVWDDGEPGYDGYTMYAIDVISVKDGMITDQTVRETVTGPDGTYRFDGIRTAPVETTIQTGFFPAGHVVLDKDSSWFSRISPEAGQTVMFDVGFHCIAYCVLVDSGSMLYFHGILFAVIAIPAMAAVVLVRLAKRRRMPPGY